MKTELGLDPVCDFCLRPDPKWDYDCKDFVIMEFAGTEVEETSFWGPWATCESCSEFIEADDRAGLLKSVLDANFGGERNALMVAQYTLLLNNFHRRRIGPRVPLGTLDPVRYIRTGVGTTRG
jgi:hypothetical protein